MKRKTDPSIPVSTASTGRRCPGLLFLIVLGLLSLQAAASRQSEFRVHAYIQNDQTSPAVATDGAGRFLAVWVSERQDGQLTGIFARLFNSLGIAEGQEFQVNTYWQHLQEKPFVTAGPPGRYLIVWINYGRQDISVRLFDTTGFPLTGEFPANERSWEFKGSPAAAIAGNGDFVVVWHTHGYDAGPCHIYARLFDSLGNPRGPQFLVSQDASGDQMNPSVAMHQDGHFTVVWTRFREDTIDADIIGRPFSRSGIPLENEFIVNTTDTGRHDRARIAMDTSGAFMVGWHAYTYTKETYNVLARRFSPAAVPLGAETVVNTCRTGWQVHPAIASGSSGHLLSWQSFEQDGDRSGIFATVLDKNGHPRLPEFQVNRTSQGRQERPAGAFLSPNRVVVLWQDFRGESSGWDVYAAIFDLPVRLQDAERPTGGLRIPRVQMSKE